MCFTNLARGAKPPPKCLLGARNRYVLEQILNRQVVCWCSMHLYGKNDQSYEDLLGS